MKNNQLILKNDEFEAEIIDPDYVVDNEDQSKELLESND